MKAGDLMTSPAVTVAARAPIQHVATLLLRRDIGAVPVVDAAGRLLGIVSEADLLRLEGELEPRDRMLGAPPPPARVAADVMTRDVTAVEERDTVARIARLMLEGGVRHLPVLRDGHVVGMVSRHDLLRVLARTDREIAAAVELTLRDEMLVPGTSCVGVRDGVVTLRSRPDRIERELAATLVHGVPGVIAVEFA
jgi:CBS domain-containing protein